MTEPLSLSPEDEDDALAAEYVLGVLDLAARTAVETRARSDDAFRARLVTWEARLAGLNAEFAEVPAPDLLPAIEARLFPMQPRPRRVLWPWLAGAAVAGLAALTLLWPGAPVPQGPVLTATLSDPGQSFGFAATLDPDNSTVMLVRSGDSPAGAGQDLQLWVIGESGTPAPLGLIRSAETTLPAPGVQAGMVLAVSLEPEGGSPTGLPTGPVLLTGVVELR
jgi:anti-sigma-K factor RskA